MHHRTVQLSVQPRSTAILPGLFHLGLFQNYCTYSNCFSCLRGLIFLTLEAGQWTLPRPLAMFTKLMRSHPQQHSLTKLPRQVQWQYLYMQAQKDVLALRKKNPLLPSHPWLTDVSAQTTSAGLDQATFPEMCNHTSHLCPVKAIQAAVGISVLITFLPFLFCLLCKWPINLANSHL